MDYINNFFNFEGKLTLITGASGNIGSLIAKELARLGSDLILIDKNNTSLSILSDEIKSLFKVNVSFKYCDFENTEDRRVLIEFINKEYQLIDILINNAAFVGDTKITGWAVPFTDQSIESWNRAMEVNLTSPFHLCQGLSGLIKKSASGSIINIASIYGKYAPDWSLYEETEIFNPAAYSVSKAGLIYLTKWLSTVLAPNVRVNSISPGGLYRNQSKIFVDKYIKKTLLGRMATEKDVLGAVLFLASDLSSYVTGENITIDGGWGI